MVPISENQTLLCAPEGSMAMYSGPEFAVGKVYSLMIPVEGTKAKILFPLNSVPKTTVEPEMVVVTNPVGIDPPVGIGHS